MYKFLNIWVPHLYGDLDEDIVTERGYELVNSDTEVWDEDEGNGEDEKKTSRDSSDDLGDLTRESWEVSLIPCTHIILPRTLADLARLYQRSMHRHTRVYQKAEMSGRCCVNMNSNRVV